MSVRMKKRLTKVCTAALAAVSLVTSAGAAYAQPANGYNAPEGSQGCCQTKCTGSSFPPLRP